jgi:hypothetical protein
VLYQFSSNDGQGNFVTINPVHPLDGFSRGCAPNPPTSGFTARFTPWRYRGIGVTPGNTGKHQLIRTLKPSYVFRALSSRVLQFFSATEYYFILFLAPLKYDYLFRATVTALKKTVDWAYLWYFGAC